LTTLTAIVRGCGTRRKGGVYWEVKLGSGSRARPLEEFLLDPPQPVPPHLRVSPRGVQPIEVGGVTHVIDWIGSENYPNVCDFLEEVRFAGLSRRIPESFDFGKLTPESRILLVHARAWVGNSAAYGPFHCPTTTEGHPEETACCVGVWWRDVEGGVPLADAGDTPLAVRRSMPSFVYTAARRPDGVTPDYRAAFFASFPATRLVVIEGGHERALTRARRAHLDVDVVED